MSVELKHDPRKLLDALFVRTKAWWGAALLCKVGVVLLGALNIFVFPGVRYGSLVLTLFYITSELCQWRSDSFKGSAQSLQRKVDFRNSFGWEISGAEMSDLLMDTPAKIWRRIPPPVARDDYFASEEAPGVTRAIENLQESAWWSKYIAKRMGHVCLGATITLVAVSVATLVVSIDAIENRDVLSSIGRVVTSVLMLVFSLGLVRLTIGYYSFSRKAAQSEQRTFALFGSGCDEVEAIKAWHEYQTARAAAPLLPSWVWRLMQKDLNLLWKEYRRRHPSQCVSE